MKIYIASKPFYKKCRYGWALYLNGDKMAFESKQEAIVWAGKEEIQGLGKRIPKIEEIELKAQAGESQ